MSPEPTDEELRAFISAMLSNLDRQLRENDVVDDAIRSQRELWVALYRASRGLDDAGANDGDPPS